MVETIIAIVVICNTFLRCTKTIQNIWDLPGSSPSTFFQAKPWILTQRIDPTRQILDSDDIISCYVVWCCHVLIKGMVIHPQLVETQKFSAWCSHLEPLVPGPRRSVPNGSTQRFTWLTQWLHLSQRLLSTFFKQTTSVLLPSDCLFLVGSLSPQEGQSWTLQSLKTSFQAEASCKYQYRGRHPNNGG